MAELAKNIEACLHQIVDKFDKGSPGDWSTQDYEKLGLNIQSKTGVLLSVSTLKRLWGRVNHSSRPSHSTLNTLAKYLDFDDWAEFAKSQNKESENILRSEKQLIGRKKSIILIILVIIAATGLWLLIPMNSKSAPLKGKPSYTFSSRVVATGLPNSVIFQYSAKNIPPDSKIEIQQSWDKRKRETVNKGDSIATSIYYRPGYFKAKLLVNNIIVKEDDVYIPTDGWMGLIELRTKPIYLNQNEFLIDSILRIENSIFSKYRIYPDRDPTWVGFYNIKEFKGLYVDNFELETYVKNTWKQGTNICQNIRIAILYDGGAIVIPLSAKGCVSELSIMTVGDKLINGNANDLSGFGVEFNDFENVKCISKDGHLNFLVNNREVLTVQIPQIHKKIVGIAYNFEGSGTVKKITFSSNDKLKYIDNLIPYGKRE
ncbi:hypothetical protein ACH3O9_07195 [Leeuwenhoekiella sp. A16]|uniref:hypothetical protein n=1 Tax=Leeuwenhoekiella sp. A16 TaxID=3141462 RepID=UPI003A80D43E